MSYPNTSYRAVRNGRHAANQPNTPSPLRNASSASTASEDSNYKSSLTPSRSTTISSASSYEYNSMLPSSKRTIGDTSPERTIAVDRDYQYASEQGNIAPAARGERLDRPLRPISQPHNRTPVRAETPKMSDSPYGVSEQDFAKNKKATNGFASLVDSPQILSDKASKQHVSVGVSRSDSRRTKQAIHPQQSTNGQSSILESSELEQLGKSSTGYLRALSKYAEDADGGEFKISKPEQEVAGMHGRRKLQRNMSTRKRPIPGYGGGTWMDQQRQFLQAYEYLCHIGEAKEWIEDVIHKPIPPIVQLEEALRDGVILAEVVQAVCPDKPLRIFRNLRLQFRHSDNIAIFFRFLAEIELPDLFRFELVDLYEKKNIPKVIYCIHALSWLLLRKGFLDFRIGNLVGQLEFERHELEEVQKGLDNMGVSMPNFSSMRENFGAEPEPQETEEERNEKELKSHEASLSELQAQTRGALLRLQLAGIMEHLWTHEELLIVLQSRIRGDFARQVFEYKLLMKTFATRLQSCSRGFLVRARQQQDAKLCKVVEKDITMVQSLIRARKARTATKTVQSKLEVHHHGIRQIQSAIRGGIFRRQAEDTRAKAQDFEHLVADLQQHARGMLVRRAQRATKADMQRHEKSITLAQSAIRSNQVKARLRQTSSFLDKQSSCITVLQAHLRAIPVRRMVREKHRQLCAHTSQIIALQAAFRGMQQRKASSATRSLLQQQQEYICRIQAALRAYLLRKHIHEEHNKLEMWSRAITGLEASTRGHLVRTRLYDLLAQFVPFHDDFVELQSTLRGIGVRARITDTLEELEAEVDAITSLQAEIRGGLVRLRYAEKKRYYDENMKKVIKVQSFVRGRQQGQAYKVLTSGKNPPVNTVKNFVHLLNDNNFDFDEEIEVEKLRKAVGTRARENEQTEQWIAELDAKIGLLAHNKIARDEYVRIQKRTSGLAASRGLERRDTFNLKTLNKSSRVKLELYQELFFILQTSPVYLARLFRRLRELGMNEEESKRLELLVVCTFGFAQKNREQFYFLRLIDGSMKEELVRCSSVEDFLRGSFFFTRLFAAYTRAPRDRKYVKEVLRPVIQEEILDHEDLDLESDPLQIYRDSVRNEELRFGQSSRSMDIPREQAIKDPETRDIFIRHLQWLRDIVDQFLRGIDETLHSVPYSVRYVAKQMFTNLSEQFPRQDQNYLLLLVGQWVWKAYFRPSLIDPEKSGAVDRGLDPRQRRNISEVVKVITQVATGERFGDENIYLQPLNTYVEEACGRLQDIWVKLIEIPEAAAHFDFDVTDDFHAKTPPTLHIKMVDVFAIHQMMETHVSSICVAHEDAGLRDIIRDLGTAKSNETDIGAGTAEVSLALNAKVKEKPDPDADIKALMMETKRCILYIIRVQNGANLMEIMVKPVTEEDEARWENIVADELADAERTAGAKRGSTYTSSTNSSQQRHRGAYDAGIKGNNGNLVDLAAMSYPELKGVALENILKLESRRRITRSNNYQDLLNEIAVDIRLKHKRRMQRQREAESVRATLSALDEKAVWLEEKLKAYNDTFEQNLTVLQNKKAKRKLIMPFSTQWHHERELARLGRIPRYGSFKYSAMNLYDKGILVEWRGRNLPSCDITISSDEVNVFLIEGSNGSLMIPGASATFTWDDLLGAQYAGQKFLRFFGPEKGQGERVGDEGELVVDRKAFMQQVSKKFWPEG